MGLRGYIDGILQAQRAIKSEEDAQLTLGGLIERLDSPSVIYLKCQIVLDTGDVPGKLDSWRGVYAELAMSYRPEGTATVADVLDDARQAVGQVFQGYKGGDFLMRDSTPLWLANHGESGFRDGEDRMLTGVFVEPDRVVITTKQGEPYSYGI